MSVNIFSSLFNFSELIKHRTLGWARYATGREAKGNAYVDKVEKTFQTPRYRRNDNKKLDLRKFN